MKTQTTGFRRTLFPARVSKTLALLKLRIALRQEHYEACDYWTAVAILFGACPGEISYAVLKIRQPLENYPG